MKSASLFLPVIAIGLFWLSSPQSDAASTNQVVVTSAIANLATQKITLAGFNFGTTTPVVILNYAPLSVTSFTSTTIVATMPTNFTPGTYLLSVVTGTGTPATGVIDVTVGNTGATGPAEYCPDIGATPPRRHGALPRDR